MPPGQAGGRIALEAGKKIGQGAYRAGDAAVRTTSRVVQQGGAMAVGAGYAVAKPVVITIWNNIILILAMLFKLADAMITDWTFINTPVTIFLDVIFLILLTIHYNKNRLDSTVIGFLLATAFMGWIVEALSLPLFNMFGAVTPHVILAIGGLMVGAATAIRKDTKLGGVMLMFWCEVGIPLLNEPEYFRQWFLENPMSVFLILMPWWALYAAIREMELRSEAGARGMGLPGITFMAIVVFLILAGGIFQMEIWSGFQTSTGIDDQQLQFAQERTESVGYQVKTFAKGAFEQVKCSWEFLMTQDNTCLQKLAKEQEQPKIVIENQLEIGLNFDNQRTKTITMDDAEIRQSLDLEIKNKLMPRIKVHVKCGVATDEVSLEDPNYQNNEEKVTMGYIKGMDFENEPGVVVVPQSETGTFRRKIQCEVPGPIDNTKGLLFFKAHVFDIVGTTEYKRFIVEEKTDDIAFYRDFASRRFADGNGNPNYASDPDRGFAHLALSTDRDVSGKPAEGEVPGIIFVQRYDEIVGEWSADNSFALYPDLNNNADGVMNVKKLEIELDPNMKAEPCDGVTIAGTTLDYHINLIPGSGIKKGESYPLESCAIVYFLNQNLINAHATTSRVIPKMHYIESTMVYDYVLTETKKISIAKPTTQTPGVASS